MSSFNAFNLHDELPHVVHHHHHRASTRFFYYYYCCCLCIQSLYRFIFFLPKYTSNIDIYIVWVWVCVRMHVCDPHLTHTFAYNSLFKPLEFPLNPKYTVIYRVCDVAWCVVCRKRFTIPMRFNTGSVRFSSVSMIWQFKIGSLYVRVCSIESHRSVRSITLHFFQYIVFILSLRWTRYIVYCQRHWKFRFFWCRSIQQYFLNYYKFKFVQFV